MSLARKEYNREWMKEDRRINHEKYRERERRSQAKRRERLGSQEVRRITLRYNLWHQYRMPLEVFDQLVETQQGACAICRNGPTPGERLHVDHDHRTGRVRGLLCRTCNQGMIAVDRVESWPEKATIYAQQHQEILR